ncbi:MAG: putative molybdenum carrier protein [Cyanobacteria bacterium P01_F01_bin.3]
MYRPTKIISGGQNGADLGGIKAAKKLGILTGGTAPKGWRVVDFDGNDSSNPELAQYGLVEHSSSDYPPRTYRNVADSDGTALFMQVESRGSQLTKRACKQAERLIIVNPSPSQLRDWISEKSIKVLNVAGNRASPKTPDIEDLVFGTLMEAFWR